MQLRSICPFPAKRLKQRRLCSTLSTSQRLSLSQFSMNFIYPTTKLDVSFTQMTSRPPSPNKLYIYQRGGLRSGHRTHLGWLVEKEDSTKSFCVWVKSFPAILFSDDDSPSTCLYVPTVLLGEGWGRLGSAAVWPLEPVENPQQIRPGLAELVSSGCCPFCGEQARRDWRPQV